MFHFSRFVLFVLKFLLKVFRSCLWRYRRWCCLHSRRSSGSHQRCCCWECPWSCSWCCLRSPAQRLSESAGQSGDKLVLLWTWTVNMNMNVYVGLCSIAFITLIANIFMCDLNMNGYVRLCHITFMTLIAIISVCNVNKNVYVRLCSIAFITLIAIFFVCDLNMKKNSLRSRTYYKMSNFLHKNI